MNLIVYSGGIRAGVLDMTDGEPFYGFTYDGAYLASRHAVPLSLSLPLQERRFNGTETLPYFEGLLPEGDVRATIARQLGISEHSPAKLLRALGRDCAGDVAVLERDDPYQPPADDSYAFLSDGLKRIAENPFGEISRLRAGNRLSLAGGQEKIALYHDAREQMSSGWYVPLQGSPSTHIVKPQTHDAYPQLVENEFLCMQLAELIGLDVAKTHIVAHDRSLLVVKRFDRRETGRQTEDGLELFQRLKQEDFCQALGFDPSRKYETDGGPGISDINRILLTHSDQFIKDREKILRLVLFNYLVGNCDAHAKNYTIMLGQNAVRLAPAYDLVSTAIYDGTFGAELSRSMGMRIGKHANIDKVTGEDFEELAGDFNTSAKRLFSTARELIASLLEKFDMAATRLEESTAENVSELLAAIYAGIEHRAETFS